MRLLILFIILLLYFLHNLFAFMLKFLDNRTWEKPRKTPKTYKPEMLYGISYQTPAQFQGNHTLLYNGSYINPYLEVEASRKVKLNSQKLSQSKKISQLKPNLIQIQEQKILGVSDKNNNQKECVFKMSYNKSLEKSPNFFKINKGPFIDFIDHQQSQKVYGPLLGKQRSIQSIMDTKKQIFQKSRKQLNQKSSKRSASVADKNHGSTVMSLLSNTSNIAKNTELIFRRSKLRQDRNTFNQQMNDQLIKRKSSNRFDMTATYYPQIFKSKGSKQYRYKNSNEQDNFSTIKKQYEQFQQMMERRIK